MPEWVSHIDWMFMGTFCFFSCCSAFLFGRFVRVAQGPRDDESSEVPVGRPWEHATTRGIDYGPSELGKAPQPRALPAPDTIEIHVEAEE